jgi:hypothetical protein
MTEKKEFNSKFHTQRQELRESANLDFKVRIARPMSYNDEMCDMLREHMAKGYPFRTFAAVIGVNTQTIYDWLKKYSNFARAKQDGDALEFAIWEKLLMRNAVSRKGNINAIIWAQKNKFPNQYREKEQTVINNNNSNNAVNIVWDSAAEEKLKELEKKSLEISMIKSKDMIDKL